MPKLRKLKFATLDEAIADIERLRSGPYDRGGNWNLTQVCEHLASTLNVGLHGGMEPMFPRWMRATVMRAAFDIVLLTEYMPSGTPAPPKIRPADRDDEDPAAIDRCLALLAEARDRVAPIPPSPFVDGIKLPSWRKLSRIHAAHHLAFLKPRP